MKLIIIFVIITLLLQCFATVEASPPFDEVKELKSRENLHKRCDYLLEQIKFYRDHVEKLEMSHINRGTERSMHTMKHNQNILSNFQKEYEAHCFIE